MQRPPSTRAQSMVKIQLPQYLKDKAMLVFDMLDLDNSGDLERSEVLDIFAESKNKGENVAELFDNMDCDNNGIVDRQEFLAFWEDLMESGVPEEQI